MGRPAPSLLARAPLRGIGGFADLLANYSNGAAGIAQARVAGASAATCRAKRTRNGNPQQATRQGPDATAPQVHIGHCESSIITKKYWLDQAQFTKEGPWSGAFGCTIDLRVLFPSDEQFALQRRV